MKLFAAFIWFYLRILSKEMAESGMATSVSLPNSAIFERFILI